MQQFYRAIRFVLLAFSLLAIIPAKAQVIFTVAGAGNGDGSPATAASLNYPYSVVVDGSGNIYIADQSNNRIRKINTSGVISTIAGNGHGGYSGDGGPATAAEINYPGPLALDASGNVYFSDVSNNRVREISTSGIISTYAGNGHGGYSGDGGAATSAQVYAPAGLAFDNSGTLYIVDSYNNRIRVVNKSTGKISTIAGDGSGAYNGDGINSTSAELNNPSGIAIDASGNIYIADQSNERIRKINTSGIISTVAGNGSYGYTGDGVQATASELFNPQGITLDASGNLYIADESNQRVREVSTSGIISTIAGLGGSGTFSGDGGPTTAAGINNPTSLAIDGTGNIYIADWTNNCIREINTSSIISTIAGNPVASTYGGDGSLAINSVINNPRSVAIDKAQNIYFADQNNNRVREINATTHIITTIAGNGKAGFTSDGGMADTTTLDGPYGVAVDDSDNVYIADYNNARIRKVTKLTGKISTIAGNGKPGYTGEAEKADTAEAGRPTAVAVDTAGNVYFADLNNEIVRKIIKTTGIMNTIAGKPGIGGYNGDGGKADTTILNGPVGLAVDRAGNVYIADQLNQLIRKITVSTGIINTLTGLPNTSSQPSSGVPALGQAIDYPSGVAVDTLNNVYFTDLYNNMVEKINVKTDTLTVLAGLGTDNPGYNGDNIMAANAELYYPFGVAVDDSGNVFVADQSNSRIRELRVKGPQIITQPPANSYGCLGWPATIAIAGSGGATYQWQVDSMGTWMNVPNTGAYSGANTDTLHIATVTSYSLSYQCVLNSGYVTSVVSNFSSMVRPTLTFTSNNNLFDSACSNSYISLSIDANYNYYKWSTKDSGVALNSIAVFPTKTTTYSVAVTTNGCVIDTSVKVMVYAHTLKANAFPSNTVCAGQQITLYGSGGSSYSWNPGTSGNTYTFIADTSGSYIMSGLEGSGCNDSAKVSIIVKPLPVVTATASKDSICIGASVTLTGTGATSYNWSGGISNGVAFSPASSAVYYLTGTDANGCSAAVSVPVVVNTLPIVTGTASPDAVCKGASLTLTGNGAASYSWSGGVTNAVAFVPSASGSYTVTGTDAHGCTGTAAVNITVNTLPVISASAFPAAVLCQGSSLALFGAGGASYSWSGGVNNGVSFTPSASNTYTVTGIDANGCTAKDSIKVTVHHKVVPSITSNNTTCGLKNGSAVVSASNGIPPYTYSWSTNPARTTTSVDSLAPGTYVVSVSDSANCASSAAVSISASTAPILSVSTTNSNCGSQGTGSAAVAVTGGNAPYRYMWNNGDTLATNYNLRAATYIITVTDVNGCSSFAPAIVSNVNGPKINTLSTVNVKCNGNASGAINISVSGGTPPYHYLWSNGATTASISNLFAGPYQLVVVDVDSCTSVENFILTQPLALSVASSAVKADCGVPNGSASVSVTGGVAPYTYKWSNGVTANVDASVSAGVYDVIITDANGCADSNLVSVSTKTGPSLAISVSNNASCGSGGLLSVLATGGTLPYTYLWNNGVTASAISNVPAGNYYVSVTDGKGCVGSADTSISEVLPPALSLCMVTVDPLAGKHNYLIWDKSMAKKISHFNIYKESTSAGVYFKIDSVPFDSAGIYVDLLSDATVRSWRYKISQVDSCGNESPLSPAHKTMHLTVNQGVGNNINLIWDNYEGLAFSTYYVYRDTIATKFTLIDSIPNNIFTYTDNKPLITKKPLLYRIGISNPGGCNPAIQTINYNASKSNTGNFTFNNLGFQNLDAANTQLTVFPNPSNGVFTVSLNANKGSHTMVLSVINTLGQTVSTSSFSDVQASFSKQIDLSSLAKGVYFIKLNSDTQTFYNKVVIQ